METFRLIWNYLRLFFADPNVQLVLALVQIAAWIIGRVWKGKPPEELLVTLEDLRRRARNRRWDALERMYLRSLLDSTFLRTARLVGKPEPVDLEKLYTPLRLTWYRPAILRPSQVEPRPVESLMTEDEALSQDQRQGLVILGEAGAGKTTLVKHVAREIAGKSPDWAHYVHKVFASGGRYPLPLYLDLVQLEGGPGNLIADLATLTPLQVHFSLLAEEFLRERLRAGCCLVILNGLDEVLPEAKQDVLDRLTDFQREFSSHNQILVTSRTTGYTQPLQGFSEVEILPFTPYQIHRFLRNWFDPELEEADGLEQALDTNPRMAELAVNPLLLATVAFVYDLGRKDPRYRLPERKVELYRLCTSALLQEWARVSGKKRWQYRYKEYEKREVLESLAFSFHRDGQQRFAEKELRNRLRQILDQTGIGGHNLDGFWQEIYEWSGILHQETAATYSFLHLTFQEYFAACYLHEHPPGPSDLQKYLDDPWWQEVIVQLAGLRRDASEIVTAILSQSPSIPRLSLAVRCLRDAVDTPMATKRAVLAPLLDWLLTQQEYRRGEYRAALQDLGAILESVDWERLLGFANDPAPDQRVKGADILGYLGHQRAVSPLIRLLEDEDETVREVAVMALRRVGRMAIMPLTEVLRQPDNSRKRQKAAEILGWSQDPRALGPLMTALRDEDREVARAATLALGYMGEAAVDALVGLVYREAEERGEAAAIALSMIGKPAIGRLIPALDRENEAVRRAATDALCRMGPTALDPMLECMSDPRALVRQGAARVLGHTKDDQAIWPLIRALKDRIPLVRQEATDALVTLGDLALHPLMQTLRSSRDRRQRQSVALALGRIGDPEAVPVLTKAAEDRAWSVRQAAVEALGRWTDDEILPALIRRLRDRKPAVRQAAAHSLRRFGSVEAVSALCIALRDRKWPVREAAAKALGDLQDPKAVGPLIETLQDRSWQVRQAAIGALGTVRDPRAIRPLVKALGDERVYEAAIQALAKYGADAVEDLLVALDDERPAVQARTARVLAQVQDRRAVDPLVKLLRHREKSVRITAIKALGRSRSTAAVAPLVRMLDDTASEVRQAAAEALGELADPLAVEALSKALPQSSNRDWLVRLSIATALGRIGAPAVLDALVVALKEDPTSLVRIAAATALGEIGDPRARQALINAQMDPDPKVQSAAATALNQLRTKQKGT